MDEQLGQNGEKALRRVRAIPPFLLPLLVAGGYATLAMAYVMYAQELAGLVSHDPARQADILWWEGVGFIIAMSLFLFVLLSTVLQRTRRAERRYHRLLQSASAGMLVVDAQLRPVYANATTERLVGYTHQELSQFNSVLDLMPPEEQKRMMAISFKEIAQAILSKNIRTNFIRKNGEVAYVNVEASMMEWDGREHVLVHFYDVTQQVAAENAARTYHERIEGFISASNQWFWETDAEYRITYISDPENRSRLLPAFSMVGDALPDALRTLAGDAAAKRMQTILRSRQGISEFVVEVPSKEGLRHLKFTASPVYSDKTETYTFQGYRGAVEDITELKLAENRFEQAFGRLLDAIEAIPCALLLFDAEEKLVLTNSNVRSLVNDTSTNRSFSRGTSLENIVSEQAMHIEELQGNAEQSQAWVNERLESIRNGSRGEQAVYRHGKWLREYNVRTNEGGLLLLRFDVTKAYLQERELAAANDAAAQASARLRDALNHLPATVYLYDRERHLVIWNRRVEDLYPGFAKKLRVGMHLREVLAIILQDFSKLSGAALEAKVDERLMDYDGQARTIVQQHEDGRWMQGHINPTSEGGLVSLRFDITEQKQREQAMMQSQKMEALGLLTGSVAHDLNNLLQVISGHLQLLELDLIDKAGYQTTLAPIHDAMSQAVSLTRNLLAFGRRQTLHPEALDFGTVVQEQVVLLQGLMGTRVQLEFTLRDNPMVWADRNQLQQVLMNLIVNARDAMPDGGTVHVSVVTKQLSGQEDLRLAELPAGRYALLECKDTGSGISAEHLDRIFDPFFTTKPQDKGTGLGLSTVIGIVRQHGGGITVDSPQGGGARFSVYLPLHQSEEQQQETDAVRNAGKGELLLVVEDETAVREWLTDLLTRNGYRVSAAANGEDALTLVSEASERFDLAVMDVGLPGLSGVETFQRLREWKPDLPVVFCSGWQNEADESFIRESNLPLLTKPFPHVQLLKLIRSTLAPPMDGGSAGQP